MDLAIREADVVLLVVDVNEGVTQFDMEVAHLLRQAGKPTVLGVNKVDTFEMQYGAPEFYKLGLGEPFILSAENGLVPAVFITIARLVPVRRLNKVDFPTLGRPTMAKIFAIRKKDLCVSEYLLVQVLIMLRSFSMRGRRRLFASAATMVVAFVATSVAVAIAISMATSATMMTNSLQLGRVGVAYFYNLADEILREGFL